MREIKRVTRKNVRDTVNQTDSKNHLTSSATKKLLSSSTMTKKLTRKSISKLSEVKKRLQSEKISPTNLKASSQTEVNDGEVIVLPDRVSKAARMRERLLRMELDQHLEQAMYKIAYGIGLCFIMVGAAYALLPQYDDTLRTLPQTAAVLDGVESTDSTTQDSITEAPSEFTFLTLPPENIYQPYDVTFTVTNVKLITAQVIPVGVNNSFVPMVIENISGDKYKIRLDPSAYLGNYYKLRINVRPSDGSQDMAYFTNMFFTGDEEMEDRYNEQFPDRTATVDEIETKETSEITQTTQTTETTSEPEPIIKTEETEPIVKIETNTTTEKTVNEVVFELRQRQISLVSGSVILQLQAPGDADSIELYARQTNSLSARYIASASKRQDQWVFVFDSRNLPNGSYEFFARTPYKGKILTTKSLPLTVQNEFTVTAVEPIVRIQPRDTTLTEREQRFVESVKSTETQVVFPQRNEVETRTRTLLQNNSTDFDDLLRRYATAVQTGDESLIRLAREALMRRQEAIQLNLVADQASREIADKVAIELETQIQDLKQRIDSFEALRRERTAGESALDSDSDGISDYDEINLYDTDPFSADTDGDGMPDGVEIMMGLNPLVPDAEAIIQYESPKSLIGLSRPDVLIVEEVLPITQAEIDSTAALVSTEIKGRGLPNSFVTLFIFSTPTVVTVRTDADGMFVYTYEKELEDGRHDVYVAVTDNVGRIIAHSNPFSFIKEAQAFTPVDAAGSEVITGTSIVDLSNRNAYSSTLGIAVLALGIILLMLGVSLRRKEEVVVTENTEEVGDLEPVLGAKVRYKSDRREHIDAT